MMKQIGHTKTGGVLVELSESEDQALRRLADGLLEHMDKTEVRGE